MAAHLVLSPKGRRIWAHARMRHRRAIWVLRTAPAYPISTISTIPFVFTMKELIHT